ncbi:MAG TPA: DNA circularization N-terminal domain-containing protein [Polyangiaceae bacterium]|jgi:prophage DNA circulation protein|nr:DNA circularization N-terminal domain-containing protein [Polyangiaceae bacterium]
MGAADLNAARKKNPIADNPATEVWEGFDVATWAVAGGDPIAFSVQRIEEEGGNRLVLRQRPYRKGVKIDSTGGKERQWTVTCLFQNNTIDEPGLDDSQNQYPDVLNQILDSFDAQETGDLILPTTGRVRARALTYKRTEDANAERDAAGVVFTFVEDNEDSIDGSKVTRPSARSSGPRIVQEAVFDAQQAGVWDGSLDALVDAVNQLQGILNYPDTVLDDAIATAGLIRRNIENLITTFSDKTEEARSMFTDPASSRLARKLSVLLDMASSAESDAVSRQKRATTTRTFDKRRTLFDIAAELGQPAEDLLDLNQYRIEDPLSIDPGTIVRVYV